jgi:hypothetical protein
MEKEIDNRINVENIEMECTALNDNIKNGFKIIMSIEERMDTDIITMKVKINEKYYTSNGEDYFYTFQKMKDILLKDNIGIKCYGSMENVYPSPMMRTSAKAYILENGKQASMKNVVNIFDFIEINKFATANEQDKYYNNWLKSLNIDRDG